MFTMFDLLDVLEKNGCQIDLGKIKYNRIGKKSEFDNSLTTQEKSNLIETIENAKSADEITSAINKVASIKKEIKFNWDSQLHSIASVTWNETLPNVSLLFHIGGVAEIGENEFNLPKEFKTSIWRNYTVIKDGLLNIGNLPVKLNQEAYSILFDKGVVNKPFNADEVYDINLRKVQVLMPDREIKASDYFEKFYNLLSLKAGKKVYSALLNELLPQTKSQTLIEIYGEDAAKYLQSIGITDQGFSPRTKEIPSQSSYKATEFIVRVKGLSSIPSFNAFKKKLNENKKLNAADMLLKNWYDLCLETKAVLTELEFENWLLEKINDVNSKIKELTVELAKMRFVILAGQSWFKEFDTKENCELALELQDEQIFQCSVALKDIEIAI